MAAYCQVYGVIHFTSPAGWLPVHRDQLRAQRAVRSIGKLYLLLRPSINNHRVKHTVLHWPLTFTYDLDLQSTASYGHERYPCKKSEPTVKRQCGNMCTAGRTRPIALPSPLQSCWRRRRLNTDLLTEYNIGEIHRVKWRHRIYGHDTIAILWV